MSSLMMIKLLYTIPCFFAPIALFRHSFLSKERSSFRSKSQVLLDDAIPSLNSASTTSDTSTDAANGANVGGNTNPETNNPDASSSSNTSYTPDAIADQIKSLPGAQFTPSFAQFSGFFQVAPTRSIHYLYIESMNDPSNDPVIFWTNGGPGCSGLLAFGTEFGPYIFNAGGILTLNPYSWNNIANIIYVEQPAGVGFSSFTAKEDAVNITDSRAAADSYELIKQFFERFPERKSNDFYVASESFGGHYVPHCKLIEK